MFEWYGKYEQVYLMLVEVEVFGLPGPLPIYWVIEGVLEVYGKGWQYNVVTYAHMQQTFNHSYLHKTILGWCSIGTHKSSYSSQTEYERDMKITCTLIYTCTLR